MLEGTKHPLYLSVCQSCDHHLKAHTSQFPNLNECLQKKKGENYPSWRAQYESAWISCILNTAHSGFLSCTYRTRIECRHLYYSRSAEGEPRAHNQSEHMPTHTHTKINSTTCSTCTQVVEAKVTHAAEVRSKARV